MMANRLLARSLLRHASTSVGSIVRYQTSRAVASCLFQRPKNPLARNFSSSSSELMDLLARELQEEQENAVMPPELEQLMDEIKTEWRIVDDESEGTVKLFSNSGKVSIHFHCQESLPVEENYEDEEEASAPVRFTVTSSKAGKTLVMWCLSEGGVAVVEGLAVSNADDADKIFADGIPSSAYQGPEYTELPEDVQLAFTDLLQTDLGVNSDVAVFIAMFADYKEQNQYVKFLTQVQSIIE